MKSLRDDRVHRYVARLDRARRTLATELEDEVALLRSATLRQRGEWVASACAAAYAILQARKLIGSIADLDELPAPDFDRKWRQLLDRYRGAGGAR